MLEELPVELLQLIIGELESSADLHRLCQVSKHFYHVTIPLLCKSITLSTAELDLTGLISAAENLQFKHLKHTKEIWIKAPFRKRIEYRCLHHDDPRLSDRAVRDRLLGIEEDLSTEAFALDPFFECSCVLDVIFRALAENHLQSFRWDLGTCIPDNTLRQLLARQKKIQHIGFITDGECGTNIQTQYFVDLTPLTELRSLTWRGLKRYDDFESVRKFIAVNGKGLRALTLDLLCWESAKANWTDEWRRLVMEAVNHPNNFFANSVLDLKPGGEKNHLPSLKSLSLHAVSFQYAAREMAHALNMSELRTLKLWNCPYSLEVLRAITTSKGALSYKSVELTMDPHHSSLEELDVYGDAYYPSVGTFLKAFEGLEDLYLLLPQSPDWDVVADAIKNHKTTLRRLVVHSRIYDDVNQDWNFPVDGSAILDDVQALCRDTNLHCIGINTPICRLKDEWERYPIRPKREGYPKRPKCNILHFRGWERDLGGGLPREGLTSEDNDTSLDDSSSSSSAILTQGNGPTTTAQPTDRGCLSPSTHLIHDSIAKVKQQPGTASASPATEANPPSPTMDKAKRLASRPLGGADTEDILNFAQWAASADGLPDLEILAWGDFSYEGRFASDNVLLCRDQDGFRPLTDADTYFWNLIHNNMDMLTACAVNPIME